MKRRHFLTLFAAVPAVAMAQRAIPAVLGEPEYIPASEAGFLVVLIDATGNVVARRKFEVYDGLPFDAHYYEIVFKAEDFIGKPDPVSAELEWNGHKVYHMRPWDELFRNFPTLHKGDTLTLSGKVFIA